MGKYLCLEYFVQPTLLTQSAHKRNTLRGAVVAMYWNCRADQKEVVLLQSGFV